MIWIRFIFAVRVWSRNIETFFFFFCFCMLTLSIAIISLAPQEGRPTTITDLNNATGFPKMCAVLSPCNVLHNIQTFGERRQWSYNLNENCSETLTENSFIKWRVLQTTWLQIVKVKMLFKKTLMIFRDIDPLSSWLII